MTSPLPQRKKHPQWCGTEISDEANEEHQTPIPAKMVEMRKRPYVCSTQDGLMPTIASAPEGKATGSSGHGDRLVLGNKERIPRWTANKTTPTKLLYFVVPDGFAAGDQA